MATARRRKYRAIQGGKQRWWFPLQGGTPAPASGDPLPDSPDGVIRAAISHDCQRISIQFASGEPSGPRKNK